MAQQAMDGNEESSFSIWKNNQISDILKSGNIHGVTHSATTQQQSVREGQATKGVVIDRVAKCQVASHTNHLACGGLHSVYTKLVS